MSGTEDPELCGAELFGHVSYVIPVDSRGRYRVVLHFAEFCCGPQLAGGGPGYPQGFSSRSTPNAASCSVFVQRFPVRTPARVPSIATSRTASVVLT